ncbi:MAG: hypothetical protein DCC75_00155 [Proteobacteria bacterium]|nr:MAG: hypothetical protein DCC75_00155 [Pseudomonadota bacterium]
MRGAALVEHAMLVALIALTVNHSIIRLGGSASEKLKETALSLEGTGPDRPYTLTSGPGLLSENGGGSGGSHPPKTGGKDLPRHSDPVF